MVSVDESVRRGALAAADSETVAPSELGGQRIHARASGVAAMVAPDGPAALDAIAALLDYLPDHTDQQPPLWRTGDPWDRPTPGLRDLLPTSATGSYDVRRVVEEIADDGGYLELRAAWAPQLVTALCRIDGHPVGVVANQPQSMAGTLDIAASQK